MSTGLKFIKGVAPISPSSVPETGMGGDDDDDKNWGKSREECPYIGRW